MWLQVPLCHSTYIQWWELNITIFPDLPTFCYRFFSVIQCFIFQASIPRSFQWWSCLYLFSVYRNKRNFEWKLTQWSTIFYQVNMMGIMYNLMKIILPIVLRWIFRWRITETFFSLVVYKLCSCHIFEVEIMKC